MKTVLITGASRGIGLVMAKKFLYEEWRVIGTCMKTEIPVTKETGYLWEHEEKRSW